MDLKTVICTLVLFAGCLGDIDTKDNETSEEVMQYGRRIVNGTIARPGSHPHMVALTVGPMIQALYCGGSLVTQRTVLTAAHCIEVVFIDGALSSTLRATVGTNRWNEGGQTYLIDRNITHPHFDRATLMNDIGLFITTSDVAFSLTVRPVALTFDLIPGGVPAKVAGWGKLGNFKRATLKNDIGLFITTYDVVFSLTVRPVTLTFDLIPGGVPAKVAGWGKLGTDEPASDLLQELRLPTITPQECGDRFLPFRTDEDGQKRLIPDIDSRIEMCTFYLKGSGFCKGDSGSALIRISDNNQIGIVSWGILCAKGAPDVYTRISGYAEWLHENII